MPRWIRHIMIAVLLLAAGLVLLTGALTLAYTLPSEEITRHARGAVKLLESEGLYPKPFETKGVAPDNFTDAVMIDIAIADPDQSALYNALSSERHGGEDPELRSISALKATVEGDVANRYSYARYWHGYQVFLRPLLVVFDYADLRYLNMLGLAAAAFLAGFKVRQMIGLGGLVAFLASLVLTGFYIVPLSLQFAAVAYLTFIGTAVALELERRGLFAGMYGEFFLVVGALTAFLDLLTAPLLTVGIPLVAVLLARGRMRALPTRAAAWTSGVSVLSWGAGYAVTWASKWVLASRVIGVDVTAEALNEASVRVGSTEVSRPIAQSLVENLRLLSPLIPVDIKPEHAALVMIVGLLAVIVVAVTFVAMRRYAGNNGVDLVRSWRNRAPVLALTILPIGWLMVLSEHSTMHAWFTYRILAIALFAIFGVFLAGFDSEHESLTA